MTNHDFCGMVSSVRRFEDVDDSSGSFPRAGSILGVVGNGADRVRRSGRNEALVERFERC